MIELIAGALIALVGVVIGYAVSAPSKSKND